jgi:hypothetical protein
VPGDGRLHTQAARGLEIAREQRSAERQLGVELVFVADLGGVGRERGLLPRVAAGELTAIDDAQLAARVLDGHGAAREQRLEPRLV